MAETCIVCLGDLAAVGEPDRHQLGDAQTTQVEVGPSNLESAPNTIAHLLPCGHNLHHECLRPWVERANSCPICRANFNMVELCTHLDGPVQTSYAVQEKKQEADIDPSVILDDELFDDPTWQPCLFCEEETDEDQLLLCDGCNGSYHTYCVGLRNVPSGPWFCQFCREDGFSITETQPRRGRPRTRRQQRRLAYGEDPQAHEWTRVWQSVWQQTNIDLDFPFGEEEHEEEEEEQPRPTRRQQRDIDGIARRLEIAEQNGSAARFRDAANSILASRARRSVTPTPESQEEIRAWNAFDKFNQLSGDDRPSTESRKRKSRTASPAEPQNAEPERKLKRPRTRLPQDPQDNTSSSRAESSAAASRQAASAASPPPAVSPDPPEVGEVAPSFLQSLLKEVELQPNSNGQTPQPQDREALSIAVPSRSDSASPVSSPGSSPTASGFSSPRARSLSPASQRSRPSSPPPLSSRIEPMYLPRPQYPIRAPATAVNESKDPRFISNASPKQSAMHANNEINTSQTQTHAPDASITNANISKDDRKEIQRLVTANLKPLYHRKEIDTDQYTSINRDISRQLYDKISQGGGLQEDEREKWKDIAAKEVDSAVKALKAVPA